MAKWLIRYISNMLQLLYTQVAKQRNLINHLRAAFKKTTRICYKITIKIVGKLAFQIAVKQLLLLNFAHLQKLQVLHTYE
jgi:hypothetical protein